MEKVRLLIVFLLFCLAIIFLPFIHQAFELPKVLLLYLVCASAVGILLILGYRLVNLKQIHYLFLLFLSWILICSIFGVSFKQSFFGSYFRMQGILTWFCYSVLFFISGSLFSSVQFRIKASAGIVASSVLVSLIAIYQFFTLWFFGNTTQLLYSGRVISTFGQPNFLGAFLVMSLPFVWYLMSLRRHEVPVAIYHLFGRSLDWFDSAHHKFARDDTGKRLLRFARNDTMLSFLFWLSAILIIIATIFTLSRSAYLGLFSLIIIGVFYRFRLALAVFSSIVCVFVLTLVFLPDLFNQQLNRFKVDTLSIWTAENRMLIAQKSMDLIAKRPIAGYGLENFSLAFPSVVKPQDFGLGDIVVDSAHNLFLDLWVQTGIIGLGLFLIILILSIANGFRSCHSERNEESLSFTKALLCVTVSFVIMHQFSVLSVVPLVLFWLAMGAINGPVLQSFGYSSSVSRIYAFLGITLIILVSYFTVQTIRADYYFHQASSYEISDLNKAIRLDNQAISLAPWIEFYTTRKDFLLK